jgi:hypothetical protein
MSRESLSSLLATIILLLWVSLGFWLPKVVPVENAIMLWNYKTLNSFDAKDIYLKCLYNYNLKISL